MNYSGSYRKLFQNAKAAMIAAIEIYNKPTFHYRDECFVIMLVNAWELLLKSMISKGKESIYYPKKKNEPYKTLSVKSAFERARKYFPEEIPFEPVRENVRLICKYRDSSVHFYNADGFGVLIYALAQTSIINFNKLSKGIHNYDLAEEITILLMPLGVRPPIDPVAYISNKKGQKLPSAVNDFFIEIESSAATLRERGLDTSGLLTLFKWNLVSTKKVGEADAIVGIDKHAQGDKASVIVKMRDPNVSHPLQEKDILKKITSIHNEKFGQHQFRAVVHHYKLKQNQVYCWRSRNGNLTTYSNDILPFIKSKTKKEIDVSVREYKNYLRSLRYKGKVQR